jgi:hypothetical protein
MRRLKIGIDEHGHILVELQVGPFEKSGFGWATVGDFNLLIGSKIDDGSLTHLSKAFFGRDARWSLRPIAS